MNQLLPDFIQPQPTPDEVALIRILAEHVVAQPVAEDIPGLVPMLADLLVTGSMPLGPDAARDVWDRARTEEPGSVAQHLCHVLLQLSADYRVEIEPMRSHTRRPEWLREARKSLAQAVDSFARETSTQQTRTHETHT